eukprot:1450332-Alexandrium_andersonii.AAC.1
MANYELDMNGHCGKAKQEGEKNGQNMEDKREQLMCVVNPTVSGYDGQGYGRENCGMRTDCSFMEGLMKHKLD